MEIIAKGTYDDSMLDGLNCTEVERDQVRPSYSEIERKAAELLASGNEMYTLEHCDDEESLVRLLIADAAESLAAESLKELRAAADEEEFQAWQATKAAVLATVEAVEAALGCQFRDSCGTSWYARHGDLKIRVSDHHAPSGAGWNEHTQERHMAPDVNFVVSAGDLPPSADEIRRAVAVASAKVA